MTLIESRFHYCPKTGVVVNKSGRNKGKEVGWIDGGYRRTKITGTKIALHRLAWAIYYGEMPHGEIDHINGDKLDNRISNLRIVSKVENARSRSRSKKNTSGVTGVTCCRNGLKWRAFIGVGGQTKKLGLHNCLFEACCARKSAELLFEFHPNHDRH